VRPGYNIGQNFIGIAVIPFFVGAVVPKASEAGAVNKDIGIEIWELFLPIH
jgi:hypothetical protein